MSIWRGSRGATDRSRPALAVDRQSDGAARSNADLDLGQWVGEYVIVRKLGEGGFGSVYEALHPVIGKRAAVKVLHGRYSHDEGIASRFAAEARAVNQIRHRSIVDIFAFGELADRRQYYVMELLVGVPLDVYLERAQRLAIDECLAILGEIARAVHAAHDAGIAHRDLKPENIFLELDDELHIHPKVLDFGMAKLLAPGTVPVHKTRSGTPIGSPRYMSPEQCRGVEVDHRADIYAFGCMTYRMLTGTAPFEAGTALEMMMAHVSAPPVPLSNACPELGPQLDECLLKMLEKDPNNRPQSMTAAFDSLKLAASGQLASNSPAAPFDATPLLQEIANERRQSPAPAFDTSRVQRARETSGTIPKQARQFWIWPVGVLAAAAVLSLIAQRQWLLGHTEDPKVTPASSPSATAGAPIPQTSTSRPTLAEVESEMVAISVDTQPPRAEIYIDNMRLGTAPGPFSTLRRNTPSTLGVRMQGYQSQTLTITPSADQSVRVTLLPRRTRHDSKLPQDLENPY